MLKRRLLEAWVLKRDAAGVDTQGKTRDHKDRSVDLLRRIAEFRVFEFGQEIDFRKPREVEQWMAHTFKTIMNWPVKVFHNTARNWLSAHEYRPYVIEYIALCVRHVRVSYIIALKNNTELPSLIERQGLAEDITLALLCILMTTSIAWTAINKCHGKFQRAYNIVQGIAANAENASRNMAQATHNAAQFTDVVMSYITPVHEFAKVVLEKLVGFYNKVFGFAERVAGFVKVMVLWIVEKFVAPLGSIATAAMNFFAKSFLPSLKLDFGPVAQAGDYSWMSTAFTLFFGAPIGKVSLPAFKNGAMALSWFVEKGWALFMQIASYVSGVPYPTTTFETEVVTKYEEIHKLWQDLDVKTHHEIKADASYSARLSSLAAWRDELYAKRPFLLARLHAGWGTVLASITQHLEKSAGKINAAKGVVGWRGVPYWLNMFGARGTGKSDFMSKDFIPSVHMARVQRGQTSGIYNDQIMTFSKDPKDKHFDGLGSQEYHYVDDLFQHLDKEVRSDTANGLIQIVSSAPFRPLMCEPNKKNTVSYGCVALFTCTNDEFDLVPSNVGLVEPQALCDRISLSVEMHRTGSDIKFTVRGDRAVIIDGKPVFELTPEQLLTVVVDGIQHNQNKVHEVRKPLVPADIDFTFSGTRELKYKGQKKPMIIQVVEDLKDGVERQGFISDVQAGASFALVVTFVSALFFDDFVADRVQDYMLDFFVGYVGACAIIHLAQAALNYITPPAQKADEKWGNDANIDEFLLNDGVVDPQMGDTPEKVKKNKGENKDEKHERRQLRSKHRRLERVNDSENNFYYDPASGSRKAPRGHVNEPEHQAGVTSFRVNELAKAILPNIGMVKAYYPDKVTSCYMFGVEGYKWIVPLHMIADGALKYEFCRFPGTPGVTYTQDQIFDELKCFVISTNSTDLDAVEIDLPSLAKVYKRTNMWASTLPANVVALRFYPRLEDDGQRCVWVSISSRTKFVDGYGYNLGVQEMFNEAGMCGLPVIDLVTGQILGIHVAGVVNRAESFFAVFSAKAIMRTPAVSSLQDVPLPTPQSLTVQNLKGTGAYGEVIPQHAKHILRNSDLVRTNVDFQAQFGWPLTAAPARLSAFTDPDGQTISPLFKAWAKWGEGEPMTPYPQTAERVDPLMLPHIPNGVKFGVCTWEEAVFGCSTKYGLMKPIDMSTSEGPYLKAQGKKRRDCFDTDKKTIDPEFLKILDFYWERLYQGPCPMWFHDDLKDELRELIRVYAGKSRVYFITDLVWLIVQRRLWGKFIVALESDPVNSACAVGINATSIQWGQLMNRLGAFKPNVQIWNLDRERHDINVRYPVLMECKRWFAMRCEDVIRSDHAFESLGYQVHVGNRLAYLNDGSIPSGVYVTSVVGSFASCSSIVHYSDTIGEPCPPCSFYSDDDFIVWPPNTKADVLEYKEVAKTLNMFITQGDKSANLRSVTIGDAKYLSRSVVCRNGRVWAPLPIDTLRATLMYTKGRGAVDIEDCIKQRCASVLEDALQHPKPVYLEMCRAVHALALSYGFNVEILTYEQGLAKLTSAHY